MNRWFLLDDDGMTGAENMARDEFLLERAERAGGPPVLRLYSFRPPALTIGYHQDPSAVLDVGEVRRGGVDLVRRITGGRALLHEGELTYAVAARCDADAFGAGLTASFSTITGALVAALRGLGVDAAAGGGGRSRPAGGVHAARLKDGGGTRLAAPVGLNRSRTAPAGLARAERGWGAGDTRRVAPCLVSLGRFEIAVRGKKIAGSAQRRTKSAFLQHGSILLSPASGRIARFAKGDWPFLGERITSIMQEAGGPVDEDAVRASLVRAFASAFDVRWEGLVLTGGVRAEITRRTREKREEFASILGREAGG